MDMSRHHGHSQQGGSQKKHVFADISIHNAQIIAGVTTVIFFGGLGYILDLIFTALSR
jgi:hypothetical protein